MLNANTETFLACDAPYEQANVVLFGAPYDSTTSFRPGTRFGPHAIRSESFGLESYSPYQDRDLTDYAILDSGDLELRFGGPESALAEIEACADGILQDGKVPFLLGGEHLVTLGAVRACAKRHPDLHIIHFDAHTDLREDYLGEPLSHACVIRRCWDLLGDERIYQFGIRSGDREEWRWGKDHVRTQRFNTEGLAQIVEKLRDKPVYFTLDLDVLDPSVFPGTGTPEPGGISFEALRIAATLVCSKLHIVGCDVNELSPHYDPSGASTAVACKIVREMLLALQD
ncbi:agmatinase [Intestinibacillus sp. Marseille-P6563]|uniref:agmatinase n=1 Tax=Intestinibacillus sp. Marseille-P6563 TaxID=2364792 RepID=UPI000F0479EA|nr:agmatinase [Intestinibacillus sp. Marseille-P6563]